MFLLERFRQFWKYLTDRQFVPITELVEQRSDQMVRAIGVCFLLLSLLDVLQIVLPPQFTNPVWEFQTCGQLVERVPIPLIGFSCLLYQRQGNLQVSRILWLRLLSWLCGLIGVVYLLMVPLGIVNTIRIDRLNNAQIQIQADSQRQSLEKLRDQFNQATTDQDIATLITNLNPQIPAQRIDKPQDIKQQILSQLTANTQTIQTQTEVAKQTQRSTLIRNALKWILGALISGVLFLWIWYLSRWTRQRFDL